MKFSSLFLRFLYWFGFVCALSPHGALASGVSSDSPAAYSISVRGTISVDIHAANNTGAIWWTLTDSSTKIVSGTGSINCNVNSSSNASWTVTNIVPSKTYLLTVSLLPGCSGTLDFSALGFQGAMVSVTGSSTGHVSVRNSSTVAGPAANYPYTLGLNPPLVVSPGQMPDLAPSYLAAGASTSIAPDKPVFYVGLGRMRDGTPSGVVGFRDSVFEPNIFNSFGLYFFNSYSVIDHEVDLVYSNLALRQAYSREVLLDVVTINPTSYRMDVYSRIGANVQQPGGAGTLCTFTGAPFVSYTISQLVGGSGVDITRTEDGAVWETSLSQSGSVWTLNDWHRQNKSASVITTTYSGSTSATVSVTGPASGLSSQVPGYTDKPFSWTKSFTLNGSNQYVLTEKKYGASEISPVTTDYAYYTASSVSSGAYINLLQYTINPDNTWKSYTYFVGSGPSDTTIPDGLVKTAYHPWLDNRAGTAPATAAASPSTALDAYDNYTYTYVAKGQGSTAGPMGSAWLPSTRTLNAPGGTVLAQTQWSYNVFVGSLNGLNIWSQTQKDFSDATHNLATTSQYFVPSSFAAPYADYFDNKCVSTVYPTGKKDSYAYMNGAWDPVALTFTASNTGTDRLVLCFHGRVAAGTVPGVTYTQVSSWTNGGVTWSIDPLYLEASRSTISESVVDGSGRAVFNGEDVFVSATSMARISGVKNVFDTHGRMTNSIDVMRSVSGNSYQTQYQYAAGLVSSMTAPDGVVTSYQYDDLLRTYSKTVGQGGPALYPAQTLLTVYDAASRPVSVMSTATSPSIYYYDTAGRVTQRSDPAPTAGTYLNTNYNYGSPTSTTVTLPTGATTTSTLYVDGSPKAISGTAQPPKYYSYSATSTGIKTTVTNSTGTDQSQGWVTTQADLLGRVITQTSPATGWNANNNIVSVASNYDATTGLLQSTSTTYVSSGALLAPNHLYSYDGAGRLLQDGLDLDNSGALVASSNDRITNYDSYFAKDANGWRAFSVMSTYPTSNSAATLQLSLVASRLTGFNGGALGAYGIVTADVATTDTNGQTVSQIESVSPALYRHHVATTLPGTSNVSYSETINGYSSQMVAASGAITEVEYDSLGRPATTHSRWNGTAFVVADTTAYYLSTPFVSVQTVNGVTTSHAYAWSSSANTRTVTVTDAAGNSFYTLYNAMNLPIHVGGAATSPVQYNYDTLGRLTTQITWRNGNYTEANWPTSGGDTTSWLIEAVTGLKTRKTFADGNHVDYTYTQLGQPLTRTWARGTVTTYAYFDGSTTAATDVSNRTQEPRGITYSDGTIPVSYTYNRLGTVASVSDVTGTRTFSYDPSQPSRVTSENFPGYYNSRVETQKYDAVYRPAGFQLGTSAVPSADLSQIISYSAVTALPSTLVTTPAGQAARTFTYSFAPYSQLFSGYTTPVTGGNFSETYSYQPSTNLRSSAQASFNAGVISQFDLNYNSVGQIQSTRQSGSAFSDYYNSSYSSVVNAYSYDAMGQLQKNGLYRGTTPITAPASADELPGRHFEFRYDAMGNRTSAGETGLVPPATGGLDDSYTPNQLNQYGFKTNYTARVSGTVGTNNSIKVLVNGAGPTGKVDRVWSADLVPGQGSAAATGAANVYAAIVGSGSTADLVRVDSTKKWFVAPFTQTFTYDADGNLRSDQIYSYVYDAENRLISMTTLLPANLGFSRWNLSFQYDYLGRRVQKLTTNLDDSTKNKSQRFAYNGWTLVAELDGTGVNMKHSYTWGLDASGSFSSTGGVGALLQMTDHVANSNFFPCYDQNGNITAVERSDGFLAAAYEYSPFGEVMRADIFDANAGSLPFGFSTKFTDVETGLLYYGTRYYSPAVGRFINRDSIQEHGGVNLYGFCGNNGVSHTDTLGMDDGPSTQSYMPQTPSYTPEQQASINADYNRIYGVPKSWSGLQITTLDSSWVYLSPSYYTRTYKINGVTYVVTNDPSSLPSDPHNLWLGSNYKLNNRGQVVVSPSGDGSVSTGGTAPDPSENAGDATTGGGTDAASVVVDSSPPTVLPAFVVNGNDPDVSSDGPNNATIATGTGYYPASAFTPIKSIGDIPGKFTAARQVLTYIANNPDANAQVALASSTTTWLNKSANMLTEEAALFALSIVSGVPTVSMYPDLIGSSDGQGYNQNSNNIPALDRPNLPQYGKDMGLIGPVYWTNFHDHHGTGTLDDSDRGWAALNGLTIVRNNNTLYFAVGQQLLPSGRWNATLYSGPLSILNLK